MLRFQASTCHLSFSFCFSFSFFLFIFFFLPARLISFCPRLVFHFQIRFDTLAPSAEVKAIIDVVGLIYLVFNLFLSSASSSLLGGRVGVGGVWGGGLCDR